MRVLILADSLALPRIDRGQLIPWEQTWPALLKRKLETSLEEQVEMINWGRRYRTIDEARDDFINEAPLVCPDIVVFQVGIVDCAPRLFSRTFQRIFLNNTFFHWRLRRVVIDLVSPGRRWILRSLPQVVYTRRENFGDCLRQITRKKLKDLPELRCYFVGIAPATPAYETHSPGVTINITAYNEIIRENAVEAASGFIDLKQIFSETRLEDLLSDDSIHFNLNGANILSDELVKQILETRSSF